MDLNGDGIDDVITGDYSPGDVHFFEGTPDGFKASVVIEEEVSEDPSSDDDTWRWMSVCRFVDWDDDGDLDMVVGSVGGGVYVNLNRGDRTSFRFGAREPVMADGAPLKVIQKSHPIPVDWDGDGILDLLVGDECTGVTFFRGRSDRTFEAGVSVFTGRVISLDGGYSRVSQRIQADTGIPGFRVRLDTTDWNNDGKLDLLVGNCQEDDARQSLGSNVFVYLRK